MKTVRSLKKLLAALEEGTIVPLTEDKWTGMASGFEVVDTVETAMSGLILLVRWPHGGHPGRGWALVEDPAPNQKVVRPLKDEKEARALIADRLAAYERMWDG